MSTNTAAFESWLLQFRQLEAQKEGGKVATQSVAKMMYETGMTPEQAVQEEEIVIAEFAEANNFTIEEARAEARKQTAQDQALEDAIDVLNS